MKNFIYLSFVVAASVSSCDKKESTITSQLGTVIDDKIAGNACSFYIHLDNGTDITPLDLGDEKLRPYLVDQKRVSVSYRIDNGYVAPCNGSKAADIIQISAAD